MNNVMGRKSVLLLILLVYVTSVPANAIYHCIDSQGRTIFSDHPCQKKIVCNVDENINQVSKEKRVGNVNVSEKQVPLSKKKPVSTLTQIEDCPEGSFYNAHKTEYEMNRLSKGFLGTFVSQDFQYLKEGYFFSFEQFIKEKKLDKQNDQTDRRMYQSYVDHQEERWKIINETARAFSVDWPQADYLWLSGRISAGHADIKIHFRSNRKDYSLSAQFKKVASRWFLNSLKDLQPKKKFQTKIDTPEDFLFIPKKIPYFYPLTELQRELKIRKLDNAILWYAGVIDGRDNHKPIQINLMPSATPVLLLLSSYKGHEFIINHAKQANLVGIIFSGWEGAQVSIPDKEGCPVYHLIEKQGIRYARTILVNDIQSTEDTNIKLALDTIGTLFPNKTLAGFSSVLQGNSIDVPEIQISRAEYPGLVQEIDSVCDRIVCDFM